MEPKKGKLLIFCTIHTLNIEKIESITRPNIDAKFSLFKKLNCPWITFYSKDVLPCNANAVIDFGDFKGFMAWKAENFDLLWIFASENCLLQELTIVCTIASLCGIVKAKKLLSQISHRFLGVPVATVIQRHRATGHP